MQYEPFPFDRFAQIVGGSNWVIARRSRRILDKYGADVICLSPQCYREALRMAKLLETEGYD